MLAAHLRTLAIPAVVFVALVATWHVYHLVQFGSLMPKTLAVKMLQGSSGLWTRFGSRLFDNQWAYLKHAVVLGPLFVLGLWLLARTVWLLPAWAALHVAAYSALRVPNYDWYYYPLFVLTPVAILAGIAQAHRWMAARGAALWPALVGATGVLALVYVWTPRTVPSANSERVDQYRLVAAWLEQHAASTPRPLALAVEIGIIGYYARAVPFVDPPGILVPDLTVELLRDWHELVRRRKPEIMIFREDLGERVTIADAAHGTEHRYALAVKLPAQSIPQHVYRRLP
jgi:hypothetical protein